MKKEQTAPKKKGLMKRFIGYYRPHVKLFVIDMFCAFLISVLNLVYPFITQEIINNYVPNGILNALLISCGFLLLVYVLKAILNYVLQYWGHLVGIRMQADMRNQLFRHLEKLPFKYFDNNKTGVIMSRMTNDLFEIAELAHHGPEDVFLSLVTIIGAFIMLCTINVWLTLMVFAFIPVMVFIIMPMRSRFIKSWDETREVQGEINANIESAVSGMRVSRAYNSAQHETEKFEKENDKFLKAKGNQYKIMGQFFSTMTLCTDFLYFVVILASGLFFYFGYIDVGQFAAYILYISALINPIRTLTTIYEQIEAGATGFRRFTDILDEEPEPENENAIDCKKLNGNIVFDNVTFSYTDKEDSNVISGFSCEIAAGKTVALVGPSGGGKTTLCHLIPRFYEINEGSISIDGIDIRDMTRSSLRDNVGIVQQDVFLFNGTIKENIAYGKFDATDEEIELAAKKANIHEFIKKLPDGYDTNVGERGVKLSGGQKQRISIARAFLKNPPILILDEATSALDNATEMLIQEALNDLAVGRTTLVVAHRLSTVKNADEIIVVTSEGISERGTHAELIANDSLYKTLYEYQFNNL